MGDKIFRWRDYEIQYLIEHYESKSTEEIRKELYSINKKDDFYPNRAAYSIVSKATCLGLKKDGGVKGKALRNTKKLFNAFDEAYEVKRIHGEENYKTLPQAQIDNARKFEF